MSNNPLQQYFRQPKVFITLPSHGIYNDAGTIEGSCENMPVFGMTGMDEILLKTPDALFSGESTVKVIESCCPNIKNAWGVSNLDVDALLVAIRIATSGNIMNVNHTCKECKTENSYEINVSEFLDHFAKCKFDQTIVLRDITIKIKPLNYKTITNFNMENFALQKRLMQITKLENEEEKNKLLAEIYKDLGVLQNKIFTATIAEIQTTTTSVTEKPFIQEWLENTDKSIFDMIKNHIEQNNAAWKIPDKQIVCENCATTDSITLDMDQSSFFAGA
jgi:hypothetical protein